jgi:prepilin-type N-terminal cleavage/methylation domain-containing protein
MKGFSLLEVLISLSLLSFMLLSLDAMELTILHKSRENYFANVALNQLQNMTERLQTSNPDIDAWNTENQLLLPNARSEVINNKIKLCWEKNECLTA